jgi:hypothetical protein
MFDALGFHTLVRRGSGSRGAKQQALKLAVSGDVIALPQTSNGPFYGYQIAVGGFKKSVPGEFADLAAGTVLGFRQVVAIFYSDGASPKIRWFLGVDSDGGHTECASLLAALAAAD